jgi:hypothetical protein
VKPHRQSLPRGRSPAAHPDFVYGVLPYQNYGFTMAKKPLTTPGKKKQPAAVETSASLESKVKAFLESGGEIEQVKSGVSGQPGMGSPKPRPAESKDTK